MSVLKFFKQRLNKPNERISSFENSKNQIYSNHNGGKQDSDMNPYNITKIKDFTNQSLAHDKMINSTY